MSKDSFVGVLKSFGFKNVPWDKCPRGFEESKYKCFTMKDVNVWAEVYTTDIPPYMWIIGDSKLADFGRPGRGRFFNEPSHLKKFLSGIKFKP